MEIDSATHAPTPDATLAQIARLIEDVADLSTHDVPVREFHAELLDRAVLGLAAMGGAVWVGLEGSHITVEVESLADSDASPSIAASRQRRHTFVEAVFRSGQSAQVPPGWSEASTTNGNQRSGEPADCLLALSPVLVAGQTVAVLELFQRADSPPEARAGYAEFLNELCHHAGEFHARRELKAYHERARLWAGLEAYSHRVHANLDLRNTSYAIVNESRPVIGCERVSLTEVRGRRSRVLAVSGVDTPNPRANSVRSLEKLVEAVVAANEPFWYAGSTDDIAPQIEEPLHAYLEESPARLLAIVPLHDGSLDSDAATAGPILGALVVERFDGEFDDEMQRRIGAVCGHAANALRNAIQHRDLPTIPVIGRLIAAQRRHRTGWKPRWLIALGVIAAAMAALAIIPADFRVEARGELNPRQRHHVFAPADGIVRISDLPISQRNDVRKDEVIAVLLSPDLEMKVKQVWGELQTVEKQLEAVRNERFNRRRTDSGPVPTKAQITARQQELVQKRAGLRERLNLLRTRKDALTVRSPIRGQVLTWDVVRRLESRPVQRGQIMMSVAKLDGPWEIQLRVPERDVGHILDARRKLRKDLSVTFQTANSPGVVHEGEVRHVAKVTDLDRDGRPVVLVTVAVSQTSNLRLRPGTTVTARIHCGRRSIGYVWFHDVIDSVRLWWRS